MKATNRPYIFISIPRVASTSIHAILGLSDAKKDLSTPDDDGFLDNHAAADMLLRRYGQEEFDRRFKFCFVRNPWDRCVSWFYCHAREPLYKQFAFGDWVNAGMPHHWDIQNGTVYQGRRTPMEQFRFVADGLGKLMVDFVGKMERFDEDMRSVAGTLGLQLPAELPRHNIAAMRRTPDYRTYYTDQTAERVGEILAMDVRMFGYSF
jgi:hypothetical protein